MLSYATEWKNHWIAVFFFGAAIPAITTPRGHHRGDQRCLTRVGTHFLLMDLNTKLAETAKLLQSIKDNLPAFEKLLEATDDWEDVVYRFYHQSFKVYRAQEYAAAIVAKLQELAPHLPLNAWFMEIVRAGTGREFTPGDNDQWTTVTRPMVEVFAHARFFLEMACKYGKELESPPDCMPSGWAALLYLYDLR
jgi:hypothetical protein